MRLPCRIKESCLTSTDTNAHIDRYERQHRSIRTFTSVDVRQLQ